MCRPEETGGRAQDPIPPRKTLLYDHANNKGFAL
jgi:hypothetical protein